MAALALEEEDRLIVNLIEQTAAGKLRWGVQPPSTAQTNIKNLHYVLRLRRGTYRLTARKDGGKMEKFIIERKAVDGDALMRLYQLATQVHSS